MSYPVQSHFVLLPKSRTVKFLLRSSLGVLKKNLWPIGGRSLSTALTIWITWCGNIEIITVNPVQICSLVGKVNSTYKQYFLRCNLSTYSQSSRYSSVYLSNSGVFTNKCIWRNSQLRRELVHIQDVDCHWHFGEQQRVVWKGQQDVMNDYILSDIAWSINHLSVSVAPAPLQPFTGQTVTEDEWMKMEIWTLYFLKYI